MTQRLNHVRSPDGAVTFERRPYSRLARLALGGFVWTLMAFAVTEER